MSYYLFIFPFGHPSEIELFGGANLQGFAEQVIKRVRYKQFNHSSMSDANALCILISFDVTHSMARLWCMPA